MVTDAIEMASIRIRSASASSPLALPANTFDIIETFLWESFTTFVWRVWNLEIYCRWGYTL